MITTFLYRSSITEYGIWDQLRIDGGKEFVLSCHIQDFLREYRHDKRKAPFKTKSTDVSWMRILLSYRTKLSCLSKSKADRICEKKNEYSIY